MIDNEPELLLTSSCQPHRFKAWAPVFVFSLVSKSSAGAQQRPRSRNDQSRLLWAWQKEDQSTAVGRNAARTPRSKRSERRCSTGAVLHCSRPSEELRAVTVRFMASCGRRWMTPPHLSPDSGVTDSDLCGRRQKCRRKCVCQLTSAGLCCLCRLSSGEAGLRGPHACSRDGMFTRNMTSENMTLRYYV